MTYVVTDACIQCKHTLCVDICPVDCFHEGPNFIVIDPDRCVDCGLCENQCPECAIAHHKDLAPAQLPFQALNAELARVWPKIFERREPLPAWDTWSAVAGKLSHLKR